MNAYFSFFFFVFFNVKTKLKMNLCHTVSLLRETIMSLIVAVIDGSFIDKCRILL